MVNPAVFFLADLLRSDSVHNAAALNCNLTKIPARLIIPSYFNGFWLSICLSKFHFLRVAVCPSFLHFRGKIYGNNMPKHAF